MDFDTQKTIIVDNQITQIGKIIKELIIEINGVIILDQSKYFLWTYKYGIQTIECQTFLTKNSKKTEITTIAESDDISQKGARFIIKTFYTTLLQNPIIKESKPDKVKESIKESIGSNVAMFVFIIIVVCLGFFIVLHNSEKNNIDKTTKQEITISNLDDSENNNAIVNDNYQSKISAEDEIKLKQFKNKVQILFDQLMIFKNKSDFQEYGFDENYKYNKWMKEVQSLMGTPEAELFNNRDYYLVNELAVLGLKYIRLEGKETEYTNWNKERLIEALKENKSN